MSSVDMAEPKLAKPGAGLPFVEWAIAKYLILPKRFKTISPSAALEEFTQQAEKIRSMSGSLSETELGVRRLIPRLTGLEDSSRYWSVAMTMQHLVIVNGGIAKAIFALSHGKNGMQARSTADVKPAIDVDTSAIRPEFDRVINAFVDTVSRCNLDQYPEATFPHPWFGELNAKQWVVMAATHQSIH